jgi:hypothetical protein
MSIAVTAKTGHNTARPMNDIDLSNNHFINYVKKMIFAKKVLKDAS